MDTETFDWRRFLTRWSEEWADAEGDVEDLGPDDAEARRRRWLGSAPASEADIAAMEARLGRRMPPSYREFLRVSDGWRHAGRFVWTLAGTGDAHWHEDATGLGEDFDESWGEEGNPEEVRAQVGLWSRALQLDVESDAMYVLLDPEDVGEDGEWAVRVWAYWRASDPERYPSFAAYMVDMHREFHTFAVDDREGRPAFVNETTRTQDAAVVTARTAALGGRYEEAARLLTEAQGYGRPRAGELLHQLALLNGRQTWGRRVPQPDDPRFLTELLPLHVAELLHRTRSVDDPPSHFTDPEIFPDTAQASADVLRRMSEGTYRYRPGGAFETAVDEAYEAARWGDTDTAWRILRAAIPLWEPLDPDHVAPVGLLADPVLAPVLTPARRLEMLATPRGGGRQGSAPAPGNAEPADTYGTADTAGTAGTADQDPGGLSWLVREGGLRPGNSSLRDFRMVLVEGVAPDELPTLLGASPDTPLGPPVHHAELHRIHRLRRREQRHSSVPDDKALLRVGRAATGWSFGFEESPTGSFSTDWFRSPAPAASARGGTAVVVWGEWRSDTQVFHLSVAEGGAPLYAYTVRDGTVETETGTAPPELAPASLGFSHPDGSEGSEPDETAPGGTEPVATKTVGTEPVGTKTGGTEPVGTKPDETAPDETAPAAVAHAVATLRALDALAERYGVGLPRHALTEGRLHSFESVSWVREPRPGDSWVTLSFG
ncbi:SMI1/KNR4 family protein [Streptomyces sp. NPDC051561]|uniref:SMI1/KNR4 family protein n=1 Tax=Streptomyces sp. NPDC051561 TaxID=3365658 RepID=UPI003797781F